MIKIHKLLTESTPSAFERTLYRPLTPQQLIQIHESNLSVKAIINGLWYTMVGKGIISSQNGAQIVAEIQKLIKMYPDEDKYKQCLSGSKTQIQQAIERRRHR